jgi:glycosyltransferase involved in cell wall biosynthesis
MAVDPRVDQYLVNSPIIKRRLWKYYKRDSKVLYPPVEVDRYYNDGDHGFYLHLGRLDEEKGVPAVVGAFEGLNECLVMAGGVGDIDRSVLNRIEQAKNVEWRGFVDEDEKFELLARCSAVVFNGRNEDFGIVPIEANASGKPVVSRDDGFPGMFVDEGTNGVLHDGTEQDIKQAITRLREMDLLVQSRTHVTPFTTDSFLEELRNIISYEYTQIHKYVNI